MSNLIVVAVAAIGFGECCAVGIVKYGVSGQGGVADRILRVVVDVTDVAVDELVGRLSALVHLV